MKDLAVLLLLAVLIVAGVILLGENRRDPLRSYRLQRSPALSSRTPATP